MPVTDSSGTMLAIHVLARVLLGADGEVGADPIANPKLGRIAPSFTMRHYDVLSTGDRAQAVIDGDAGCVGG